MLSWIREKFGTVVIGLIIGFIAFVFVFYGVFSPKSTRGLHDGAVAGTVNGEPIRIDEFNRALKQRLEMFKNIGGGNIQFTEEQLKAFGIRKGVFDSLVQRKLLIQEAGRQGMQASDVEIRELIRQVPEFQKDGRFDYMAYKNLLEANQYTVSSYERLIRDDLSAQRWNEFFRSRVKFSDVELKQEFQLSEKKRTLKYVLLTQETGRKGLDISETEIKGFLSKPEKLNLVKSQFEAGKDTLFKGKKIENVQVQIAKDLLAGEKQAEIRKANEALASRVLPMLTAGKASDAKLNAILKPVGAEVKTSGWVSAADPSLPGIGDAEAVLKDAFAANSPIDGKAKKYELGGRTLVALVTEKAEPDHSKLESRRAELAERVTARKQRDLFSSWMKNLMEKAEIEVNHAVVGDT
ncbi:MAG: hypothetical protein A2X94_17080 [Bdellovibrionales bacterium GWB1_55_8]|nr:MAG: hypothetical protein A2X94_17080 [Bdellovibrionales bacterium GWB1_55_8]